MPAPDGPRQTREIVRISPRSAAAAVGLAAAALVVLRVADLSSRVLAWILAAAVAAGLLHGAVRRLSRHMRRGAAVALVMVVAVGGSAGLVYGLVDDVTAGVRALQDAAPRRAADLERSDRFGEVARDLELVQRTRRFVDEVPDRLRGGPPAQALRSAATRGVALLAITVLTVFLLLHGPRLVRGALAQVPDPDRRRRLAEVVSAVNRRAFGYTRGILAMAVVAAGAAYLVARTAEVPGALALALWVGLWSLVPVAGAVVGALPIVGLAMSSSGGRALAVAAAFVAYQALEHHFAQRPLEARTLRLGPFLTLAAGLVGVEVAGAPGALLFVLVAAGAVAAAEEVAQEDPAEEASSGQPLSEQPLAGPP